ncbi:MULTISPECIES: DUF1156 domain-containing protein [unclassified Mesotoga]|uniref:DUF1156 domain-containing protein n=1 Tax=unclassified Mesotoga TaxID=1184398 RepID=UPI0025FD8248|nr:MULTISPECIES: DUF1156 domain-containing protein [unclassified Mesotoga]
MSDRRFIEESFPVKEVGTEAAKEKNIRHGNISTLHIWWSRKPLASSRATTYAALVPEPKDVDDLNARRNFIIELSKWENSNNRELLDKARKDILKANDGKPPKVLDPFGGGGSIPLEALRLGCETYTGDLNPVAVLIQKATLEYPQKYGKPVKRDTGNALLDKSEVNPLLEDVKKWANWVLEEARKDIGDFYPNDPDGSIPVGYYWMRTVPCQNPSCKAHIPLTTNWWLANKSRRKIAVYPYAKDGKVEFKIVGTDYEKMPDDFDPDKGTVSRAVAVCPVCGSTVEANTTRRLFREAKAGERMVAVILTKPGETGKRYRIATEDDMKVFNKAAEYMEEKRRKLHELWGIDPVPDEEMPPRGTLGFRVQPYGMTTWGSLFNARQKLSLITFTEKVREAYRKMIAEGMEREYAKAIATYIAIIISRCSDFESSIVRWFNHVENTCNTFSRQALPMCWDYFELNLFSESSQGTISSMRRQISRALANFGQFDVSANPASLSAISLPYNDNYFDAVITDPPYYDNVPYSYLSDFFYVWLKRSVGDLYPELFSTSLTPKKNEIVAYSTGEGAEAGKRQFEEMLSQAFSEIQRVLKSNGLAVIVYAHKTTEGWETLINSLLDSGLVMTAAWPVNTEMQARLRSQESAALASSIYIVARKVERSGVAFYNEVREELKKHLDKKLDRLWAEGIGGGDFFIAAIGSAIEIFGKYEKVMDLQGNIMRADRLLEDVRTIATDYAIRQILHNGFASEISDKTRLYVLWRWNYADVKVPFDEARKLAQSCGLDLSLEWNGKGFIRKEKEFVRLLGPQDRKLKELEDTQELIDVLHKTLLLWESSKREELVQLLSDSGFGKNDAFYRVAQAISETLPNENKEKKLLDGFLAGRERIREDSIKKHEKDSEQQGRLF